MEISNTGKNLLVSIAVCTYNGTKFLREQLDSLVQQTYTRKEIIVIDDCSTDGTLKILEEYGNKYNFFSYFQNKHNLGYVKNFEKAISLCKGDYIALSDQDDIWELDKIKLQVAHIGDHALIYHDSACIDENGRSLNKKLSDVCLLYQGHLPYPFMFFNSVSGHSMLFRSNLVPDILPFDARYFHDKWIAFIASERGGIKLLPQQLVKYRQHSSSSTDLLEIRASKKHVRHIFFNREAVDWIAKCSERSVAYQAFFKEIISCFSQDYLLIKRFKLYRILVSKSAEVLFVYKKSRISKMNYLRKLCFMRKYSNDM
jgi:glycosyltransferase involved in cell wall biosynthesis